MVAKGVLKEHLILLANSMTCAGNFVGFNSSGYKALSRALNIQVPFTEATLFTPRKCFERAAEKCHMDSLSSIVASCSWGKHVAVGTGSRFDILWDTREGGLNQEGGLDVFNFLHMVSTANGEEATTGALGAEVDDLMVVDELADSCLSPELDSGLDRPVFEDIIEFEDKSETPPGKSSWENDSSVWGTNSTREDATSSWGKTPAREATTSTWGIDKAAEDTTPAWGTNTAREDATSAWGKTREHITSAGGADKTSENDTSSWGKTLAKEPAASSWGIAKAAEDTTPAWGTSTAREDAAKTGEPPTSAWGASKVSENDTPSWGKTPAKETSTSTWGIDKAAEDTTPVWGTSTAREDATPAWGKSREKTASAWGTDKESDNDTSSWGKNPARKSTTSTWGIDKAAEDTTSAWGTSTAREDATPAWGKSRENPASAWGTDKESENDRSSWGKTPARKPTNSTWGTEKAAEDTTPTSGTNTAREDATSTWGKTREHTTSTWGTDKASENDWSGRGAEKVAPIDLPLTTKDVDEKDNGWGAVSSGETETGNENAWEQNKSSEISTGSWGQKNPPETETQPASLSGWDSPSGDGNTGERHHQWGQNKKSRFEGSKSWVSSPGEWKNKNRPAKPPGMINDNSSVVGLYTATRQRLDMFPSEEQDVLSNIEPIMRSIRRIMHQSGYNDGDPLSADDQSFIIDNVLNYHPDKAVKMGSGIGHLTVDRHGSFQDSRCFFVVTTDGHKEDFSYRKCLENYIKEKYADVAETFIGKYFTRRGGNRERNPTPSQYPIPQQTPSQTPIAEETVSQTPISEQTGNEETQ